MKKSLLSFVAFIFVVSNITAQIIGVGSLTITATTTPATACTPPCDGTATLNVTGGTPPYTFQWGTTPVQTTQTATGLCPDEYFIKVMDSGSGTISGTMATATVTCNTANAVNELTADNNISVFPNPAHDELNILINTFLQGAVTFSITGILGAEVYRDAYNAIGNTNKLIDISFLPKGIYNIKFITAQSVISKQFIKE